MKKKTFDAGDSEDLIWVHLRASSHNLRIEVEWCLITNQSHGCRVKEGEEYMKVKKKKLYDNLRNRHGFLITVPPSGFTL